MAQRWSIKEDIIVCNFCWECENANMTLTFGITFANFVSVLETVAKVCYTMLVPNSMEVYYGTEMVV